MIKEKDYPPYVAARIWMAAHPYTVEYWISGE
jgi:ABC-type proline/glycine betaine transport system substrate-binding protein